MLPRATARHARASSGAKARPPVRDCGGSRFRHGDYVFIDVVANAFQYHMVRIIAGVLMEIGQGDRDPGWAREELEGRNRKLGGVIASPQGLYLIASSTWLSPVCRVSQHPAG